MRLVKGVDQMLVDEMSVDEMSVDELMWHRFNLLLATKRGEKGASQRNKNQKSVLSDHRGPKMTKRVKYIIQGDQIGQILAHCAIVFLGQFFENYRRSPKFCYFYTTDKAMH
jgi:hypothetical protein